MAVITLSRQLGSLGREIAQAVAVSLDYRLVWREVINDSARRAGAPDAALATIDELGLLGVSATPREMRVYCAAVEQVMRELAAEGRVIILGRAGQVILRGVPGVLHVRLIAPADIRASRVAAQQGVSLSAAHAQIESSDRSRGGYVKRYYHARWDDPEAYHLVLNTGELAAAAAAEIIRCAACALPELHEIA